MADCVRAHTQGEDEDDEIFLPSLSLFLSLSCYLANPRNPCQMCTTSTANLHFWKAIHDPPPCGSRPRQMNPILLEHTLAISAYGQVLIVHYLSDHLFCFLSGTKRNALALQTRTKHFYNLFFQFFEVSLFLFLLFQGGQTRRGEEGGSLELNNLGRRRKR